MRYRALDANSDMTFGHGSANYLANSPQAVAQAVQTRLLLWLGEWFIDTTDGTPWTTQIMGVRTAAVRDPAVRSRILGTPGVLAIRDYSSGVVGRAFNVSATVDTAYGLAQISVSG